MTDEAAIRALLCGAICATAALCAWGLFSPCPLRTVAVTCALVGVCVALGSLLVGCFTAGVRPGSSAGDAP